MTRIYWNQLQLFAVAFALCVALSAIQPASAGLLLGNGNAALSGTVPLLDSSMGNLHYGDIEYAVFNSAGFTAAFPGENTPNGGATDPNEVIYAFQVYDNGAKPIGIFQFSAGLADLGPPALPLHHGDNEDDNELVTAGDADFVALGGQSPDFTQVIASALHAPSGSNVKWTFAESLKSEWSAVLYYTSPNGPRWDNGSTTTGAGQSRIPAPEVGVPVPEGEIPEPSSLMLAAAALIGLSAMRRQR